MTRCGVPDDDMPDSQPPPFWGPASDERDLDAVLSGESDAIPESLRPVADALAALRAAAAPAELSGEGSARAAFRAAFQATAAAGGIVPENAEPETVPERTLIRTPDRAPAGRPRHRVARHRRQRPRWPRSPGGSRRPGVLIASVAALALAVLAIAFAGLIPGPSGRLASSGKSVVGGATVRGTGKTPRSPTVYGSGNEEPTVRPTAASAPASVPVPSASPPAPTTGSVLCHELYEDYVHPPRSQAARKAALVLWRKLRELARGHGTVIDYCLPYLGDRLRGRGPRPASFPSPDAAPTGTGQGYPGTGSPGSGSGPQGAQARVSRLPSPPSPS